jgi:hypothetical protein
MLSRGYQAQRVSTKSSDFRHRPVYPGRCTVVDVGGPWSWTWDAGAVDVGPLWGCLAGGR